VPPSPSAPQPARAAARFPRGLYALTPDIAETTELVRLVGAAIRGGAAAIQYRNKPAPDALRREQVQALVGLCRSAGVPLIVNDDLALAIAFDADGAHLGREDGDLAEARKRLGPGRFLGASCYNRLELARTAVATGADYVAFGSAFASPTKPGAVRAPLELYREARRDLPVPIVAIGGITVANAGELLAAGVDAIAVITALFAADDVERRAREFRDLCAGIEPS
jgi:thiamine-phosphate pyrophosphorylase